MKAILTLAMALFISFSLSAQNPDSTKAGDKKDTTNLILGKKKITIVDKNDGETDIKVTDTDKKKEEVAEESKSEESSNDDSDGDNNWKEKKQNRNFKGHWDAFQIGINNYLSADKSTSLPDNASFMTLNTNKSIAVNINFAQQSFGLIGKHFGLLTGMGLEFSNYVFDGNNSIIKDNGQIVSNPYDFKLEKSKLTTTYLTVPLLLEYQFPGDKRSNRLFVNAGVVGGLKLGSHTKIKYKEDGDKQNKKNRNDFYLNSLRYGFTGRVGIKNLSIFGTYYPVTLFEKNKGPELYPFVVGLSFDGF